MRLIASIVQAEVIEAILRCLRLPTRSLEPSPARPPPQRELELSERPHDANPD